MVRATLPLALVFVLFIFIIETTHIQAAKKKVKRKSRAVSSLGVGSASQHSCVVLAGGLGTKCFGSNLNGQLGQLSSENAGDEGNFEMGDCLRVSALGEKARPTKVVMGSSFTCALLGQGSVRCFGDCASGVCGNGITSGNLGDSQKDSPADVPAISFPFPVVDLSAGEDHVCVVLSNWSAYCWGKGQSGQLGTGTTVAVLANPPSQPIDFGSNRKVLQISAGYTHTCAILESIAFANETDLVCFGSCVFGKCGSGQEVPIIEMGAAVPTVELGKDALGKRRWAIRVSAGAAHTCVVLNTGDGACFGFGPLLGTGSINNIGDEPFEMDDLAVVALNGRKISSISAGQQHTCAVVVVSAKTSKAVCWGENANGVLGYDNQNEVLVPGNLMVRLPASFNVAQISAYAAHTCALSTLPSGSVLCWGDKGFGRLGLFALGSTVKPCVGCGKHQMRTLKKLNFGCTTLTDNGSCPFLLSTNPVCEICKKSWPEKLCRAFTVRCRWDRKAEECSRK